MTPLPSTSSSAAVGGLASGGDALRRGTQQLERFLIEARNVTAPSPAAPAVFGAGAAATHISPGIYRLLFSGFDSLKVGFDEVAKEVDRLGAMGGTVTTETETSPATGMTTILIDNTGPAATGAAAATTSATDPIAMAIAIGRRRNVSDRGAAARSGSGTSAKASHGGKVFSWWVLFLCTVFHVSIYNRWVKWFHLFLWARRSWVAVNLAYRRRRPSEGQDSNA